jgi:PqqD family protein of HPr-rel-A system
MKPRTDVAIEDTDGELIVLDKDAGKVHQLNKSASLVWRGLSDGLATDDIAATLADAFEIEHESAITDVRAAVTQLRELGLLVE